MIKRLAENPDDLYRTIKNFPKQKQIYMVIVGEGIFFFDVVGNLKKRKFTKGVPVSVDLTEKELNEFHSDLEKDCIKVIERVGGQDFTLHEPHGKGFELKTV